MKRHTVYKYLLCTWPKRLALAFIIGYLSWNMSGKNLLILIGSIIISLIVFYFLFLNFGPVKRTHDNDDLHY
jgi:hypothetical protein